MQQELHITLHRVHESFGNGGEVTIGNGDFPIRQTYCQKEACPRCTSGTGGYVFNWVSPKWTAVEFIADPALSIAANKSRAAEAFYSAAGAPGTLFDNLTFIKAKLGGPAEEATGESSSSQA